MCRVGQNRIYTPYLTVYLVISLPKIPYIHRIYIWFWPTLYVPHRCLMSYRAIACLMKVTTYISMYTNSLHLLWYFQGWVIRTFETSHTD